MGYMCWFYLTARIAILPYLLRFTMLGESPVNKIHLHWHDIQRDIIFVLFCLWKKWMINDIDKLIYEFYGIVVRFYLLCIRLQKCKSVSFYKTYLRVCVCFFSRVMWSIELPLCTLLNLVLGRGTYFVICFPSTISYHYC